MEVTEDVQWNEVWFRTCSAVAMQAFAKEMRSEICLEE